jgi:hypothetical protein
MPKRISSGKPENGEQMPDGPAPPLLSEKLIAQLQGAVIAAQRKRLPDPVDAPKSKSGEQR